MRAAALAVAMLVFGFIFGGTLGFVVGGAGTVTITTTAVVPTTLISTETRLTTVEVTRTQFTTSLVTVTQTVTPSPQPTVGEIYSLKILEVVVEALLTLDHFYHPSDVLYYSLVFWLA
jgi:hypothetical protein